MRPESAPSGVMSATAAAFMAPALKLTLRSAIAPLSNTPWPVISAKEVRPVACLPPVWMARDRSKLPRTPLLTLKVPSMRPRFLKFVGSGSFIENLPVPSALPSDNRAGANTAALMPRTVITPSTLQVLPHLTFAVPEIAPSRLAPPQDSIFIESPLALPFIANVESVTSGRKGSVKPDAVTSNSIAGPVGVSLAERLSGPRTEVTTLRRPTLKFAPLIFAANTSPSACCGSETPSSSMRENAFLSPNSDPISG